jgi:hypothetical protein
MIAAEYTLADKHRDPMRSMIQARSIRWVITVLPFVPLILFVIPKAFVVMPEPGEFIPWYTKYTEVPWLLNSLLRIPDNVAHISHWL